MLRSLVLVLILSFFPLSAISVSDFPPGFVLKNPYVWPVKGYDSITGTFGEFRTGHFHMGQDFSTGGRIGIPIVAAAKGKITRVQRRWTSIGYALFLQHDDGMTSRYGHLHKFSQKVIKQILKSKQAKRYKDRTDFDIALPEPVEVEAGETIAFSGDTGVGPPHLHFELFKDNVYYNPVHYGLGYNVAEPIVFNALRITPQTPRTFINGRNETVEIPFYETGGNRFELSESPTLFIQGKVGIQIAIHQKSNSNRLGIFTLDMLIGENVLQGFQLSKILKEHTRKNVLLYDSSVSKPNGNPFSYYLHTRDGNDLLGMRSNGREQGLLDSEQMRMGEPKEITIRATGMGGQMSFASFYILKDQGDYSHIVTKEWKYNVYYDRYTTFKSKDTKVELFFPVNAVYSKAFFEIEAQEQIQIKTQGLNQLSSVYKIGPDFKDFNLGYDLYVKVPKSKDINSADLYEVLPDGNVKKINGSSFSSWGQFFKVRLRKTGMFVVLSDQTPPTIYLHELMSKTVYPREDFALYLKAVDVGSGIMPDGFDITVDGIPGKAEFFPKDGRLEIFEPEILYEPGKHTVLASVRDFAGNWSSTVRYDYEIQAPPVPEEKKKLPNENQNVDLGKDKKNSKETKTKPSSPKVQKAAKPIAIAPKAKDKKSTSR
ncbi:M23 family metallopeptidase [Leptospira sp. 2 VSF19]|uniref:M23 family metallopeptidase n=1 Tax=Leptospira soteropolitanensis TaxID=2950025 RepID=A0AAW5VBI2_9LEPT|nr:M23 family metallopeptidase [Leptospira soteropolitanensis]MCW7491598.1 M23 family metallopeptidase [Leptospira soteropolitanensis]MCW7499182.1 M23 family metallopeptidase [Leptospira soteropolitanensis]MCW7521226.1 M23 family metallopeptidase [Leptospira soteropolitanensis]MCW7525286.1 M23 family metallopeptidase [Leptospira soteropolitanensis]MCW7529153.1 M23 family metallopeptidase [Leptospira soteropolitanensis]